jgi:hypothetical protein
MQLEASPWFNSPPSKYIIECPDVFERFFQLISSCEYGFTITLPGSQYYTARMARFNKNEATPRLVNPWEPV